MSDTPESTKRDYRHTVFLPKTDFPMKAGLPQKEPLILEKWKAEDLYGQIRAARAGHEKFILHDGPPYANGDIHIGHALNKTIKDMVVRTQSLLGKDAPYVPGWDCHGLPIEWKIEEQYRKKKLNKDEVPVKEFRAECRAYAQHWVDVQSEQFQRLGITGDWAKPYLTMAPFAEATIVSELFKFAETDQLYRGAKPVMWSPVEKTALAEAEIEYEDITSTQIDVAFEIVESPIPELVGAHAVIWTTTPWTIPVNQALAYGPDIDYRLITYDDENGVRRKILVADELWPTVDERIGLMRMTEIVPGQRPPETIIGTTIKGVHLAGTIARHPMHHLGGFFARPRPFLPGNFVTTDSGTGLVHMAPDHGEDDFELCKANGIDPVFAVEGDGKYREDWAWLGGQGSVINNKFNSIEGPILQDLTAACALMAHGEIKHSYPHSWRSKAKVIYRCTPQWFVAMDKVLPFLSPKTPPENRWEGEGGAINPAEEGLCDAPTLRGAAMTAISRTRFVPEKGRNRIGSMVEGRPDWVLSRQRAWGVPIALFVERKTGQLLVDHEVNQRIIAAINAEGVDAWEEARAAEYLGNARDPADFEMVTDILDVWFDSGCTHVFTLESGHWPDQRWPADLYLEGSDQHRGWFQSSLLESCGTRGRAPFAAVLTHGFTMDPKGMKMSKSLGNTISPLDLMRDYGADILRLWAMSVDFTEDHRIGKEILAGVADQYRKLRNTFRYLLGALDGFTEAEKVAVDEMPELERYMLSRLSAMDERLRNATANFDFNDYTRALTDFANNDLSAFFFDIRKDALYCDVGPAKPEGTLTRRSYRTVLDTLFHALVCWANPVLVFTAEEVWGTRYPDAGSVHLLEWPEVGTWRDEALEAKWKRFITVRELVNAEIEPLRREKVIRSSLECDVILKADGIRPDEMSNSDWAELLISSTVTVESFDHSFSETGDLAHLVEIKVAKTDNHKCGRCWRHLPEVKEDGDLCDRCEDVVNG